MSNVIVQIKNSNNIARHFRGAIGKVVNNCDADHLLYLQSLGMDSRSHHLMQVSVAGVHIVVPGYNLEVVGTQW